MIERIKMDTSRRIDRLQRKIERLEAENENLRKENSSLKAREAIVNDLANTYTELIKELTSIRERYSCALRDTIEMRKHFQNEFKDKIKAIRKV